MRRTVSALATVFAGLLLPGCPIYPDGPYGCYDDYDCPPGYQCDAYLGGCYLPTYSGGGSGGSATCTSPSQCGVNETCTAEGVCRIGDCSFAGYGCVEGYRCAIVDGVHGCVTDAQVGGAGGASATGGYAGASPAAGAAGSGPVVTPAGAGGLGAAGAAGAPGPLAGAGGAPSPSAGAAGQAVGGAGGAVIPQAGAGGQSSSGAGGGSAGVP